MSFHGRKIQEYSISTMLDVTNGNNIHPSLYKKTHSANNLKLSVATVSILLQNRMFSTS